MPRYCHRGCYSRAQGALAALGAAAGRQADGAVALCCAVARACAGSPAYGRTGQVVAKLAGALAPTAAAEVCAAAGAALREAARAGPGDMGAGSADPDRALALAPQQLAVAECLAAGALREAGADAAAAVIGGWLPGHVPSPPASGNSCTCAENTCAECAPLLHSERLSKAS